MKINKRGILNNEKSSINNEMQLKSKRKKKKIYEMKVFEAALHNTKQYNKKQIFFILIEILIFYTNARGFILVSY